jgi:hypothetical protein
VGRRKMKQEKKGNRHEKAAILNSAAVELRWIERLVGEIWENE